MPDQDPTASTGETEWIDWEPSEPIDSPPPVTTLDWIEAELGSVVLDVLPLPGGLSSAVHRVELLDGRAVVLRRFVLGDWLEREPDIPRNEAAILRLLPRLGLGPETPSLVIADLGADRADVPAIVMTEVRGRPDLAPPDPGPWADGLARCLASIHAVDLGPARGALPTWKRWDDPDRPVPTWTSHPDRWLVAKERVPTRLPTGEPHLLHRDFHPGNVHWVDDKIVGVVDWVETCIGEPAADLAHCRWNLAILDGPELADRFTTTYRRLTGYRTETTAHDLSVLMSTSVGPVAVHAWHALGRRDLTPGVVAERADRWLTHVLRH